MNVKRVYAFEFDLGVSIKEVSMTLKEPECLLTSFILKCFEKGLSTLWILNSCKTKAILNSWNALEFIMGVEVGFA